MAKKDIKGVFLLLFFALLTAFSYNHLSPFGIALLGQWDTSKGVVSALSKTDPVNTSMEINNIDTLYRMVQKKEKTIIDVRPREIYDQGHLPSALSFPLVEFDEHIGHILRSISRQSQLIVYCSSIECTDSHTFATHLRNLKYTDVQVFSGGFRLWQEKGYVIEKNEK